DAQHKAEHLAGLAELELGEVLTINESGTGPQPVVERALMADTAAAVPIEPGSQTIEVDLQITWSLR
ncbi:MAG: SIMPL domain-containing protein, partial [Anaerolineae bacterium]